MQNIPSFKEKGEVKGNMSRSDLGYDIQCAYSISNKIGILLNAVYKNDDSKDDYYKTPGEAKAIEIGSGLFYKKNNFIFENYWFFGFSNLKNGQGELGGQTFEPFGKLTSNIFRIAVQPSITYSRKNIELAFSTRFSNVNYFNVSKEPYNFNNIDLSSKLREKSNYSFLEPAFTLRVGLKNVKIQFQTQKVFLLNKVNEFDYYYWNDSSALGLIFKI